MNVTVSKLCSIYIATAKITPTKQHINYISCIIIIVQNNRVFCLVSLYTLLDIMIALYLSTLIKLRCAGVRPHCIICLFSSKNEPLNK